MFDMKKLIDEIELDEREFNGCRLVSEEKKYAEKFFKKLRKNFPAIVLCCFKSTQTRNSVLSILKPIDLFYKKENFVGTGTCLDFFISVCETESMQKCTERLVQEIEASEKQQRVVNPESVAASLDMLQRDSDFFKLVSKEIAVYSHLLVIKYCQKSHEKRSQLIQRIPKEYSLYEIFVWSILNRETQLTKILIEQERSLKRVDDSKFTEKFSLIWNMNFFALTTLLDMHFYNFTDKELQKLSPYLYKLNEQGVNNEFLINVDSCDYHLSCYRHDWAKWMKPYFNIVLGTIKKKHPMEGDSYALINLLYEDRIPSYNFFAIAKLLAENNECEYADWLFFSEGKSFVQEKRWMLPWLRHMAKQFLAWHALLNGKTDIVKMCFSKERMLYHAKNSFNGNIEINCRHEHHKQCVKDIFTKLDVNFFNQFSTKELWDVFDWLSYVVKAPHVVNDCYLRFFTEQNSHLDVSDISKKEFKLIFLLYGLKRVIKPKMIEYRQNRQSYSSVLGFLFNIQYPCPLGNDLDIEKEIDRQICKPMLEDVKTLFVKIEAEFKDILEEFKSSIEGVDELNNVLNKFFKENVPSISQENMRV